MAEESYAVAVDDSDYLAHYGVKGMKWGVRKAELYRRKALKNATAAENQAAIKLAMSDYKNGKSHKVRDGSYNDKAYLRKVTRGNIAGVGGIGAGIAGAGILKFSKSKKAAAIGAGLTGLGMATAIGGQIAGHAADKIRTEYIAYEYLHRINPKKYPKINYR